MQAYNFSKRSITTFFLAISFGLGWQHEAFGQGDSSIRNRCIDDQLNSDQAVERNYWAHKCGYMNDDELHHNLAKNKFLVFSDSSAPTDRNADCISGLHALADCYAVGCFTPHQRILFPDGYMDLPEAWKNKIDSIFALNDSWAIDGSLAFTRETFNYIKGPEKGTIFIIKGDNGRTLEVTPNHPLVNDLGEIIPAEQIHPGLTRLLTLDGDTLVEEVVKVNYDGEVWNIEPKSLRTLANIHIAEGFLTGSIRYQNEWANDASRLKIRNKINIDDF